MSEPDYKEMFFNLRDTLHRLSERAMDRPQSFVQETPLTVEEQLAIIRDNVKALQMAVKALLTR